MGNPLGAFSAFISPPCPLTSGSFYQKFCKIHQILGICPYWVSPISSKNESWNYFAHSWLTQDTLLDLKELSTNCFNITCNLNFPFPCSLTSSLSQRWDKSHFGMTATMFQSIFSLFLQKWRCRMQYFIYLCWQYYSISE